MLSVAHISRVEKFMARRPPRSCRTLESREIDPPAGFVQPQIARISQPIIVAHTMTMEGRFQAIGRVLELAGKLDRSHGFVQA